MVEGRTGQSAFFEEGVQLPRGPRGGHEEARKRGRREGGVEWRAVLRRGVAAVLARPAVDWNLLRCVETERRGG